MGDSTDVSKIKGSEKLEGAIRRGGETKYVLRLYIAGMTPKSQRAIENIRRICDEELQGRYELEIIDVYQQPELAADEQIVAAPTLVKKLPLPLRKVIGDLSDTDRVILGLDLCAKKSPEKET